jgi:hypothetical protein
MSRHELLIILAHAQFCDGCRQRLLADPASVFLGRLLTEEEKETLARLCADDFLTPERLGHAADTTPAELDQYRDHPVARLRHL